MHHVPAKAGTQSCRWNWAVAFAGARISHDLPEYQGRLKPWRTKMLCPARDSRKRRKPSARSEEHTSELQSLMRISYAVFCLKKKTQQSKITLTDHSMI